MTQPTCRAGFLFKSLQQDFRCGGTNGRIVLQHLDGHLPTQRSLFRQIDISHSTASKSAQQQEFANPQMTEVFRFPRHIGVGIRFGHRIAQTVSAGNPDSFQSQR